MAVGAAAARPLRRDRPRPRGGARVCRGPARHRRVGRRSQPRDHPRWRVRPCSRPSCTWPGGRGCSSRPTGVGAVVAYLVGFAVRPRGPVPSGYAAREPERTSWFALAGVGLGSILRAPAPCCRGSSRPDEMVQSTDAVAHLNRIRRFLDTEVFSSLGSPGPSRLPERLPRRGGSLAQVVPVLTDGARHRRRREPHRRRGGRGVLAARGRRARAGHVGAVRGPPPRRWAGLGRVHELPLRPHGVGRAWPNLLGTALLPGVLGPALVAVGCVAPVPGLPRRLAVRGHRRRRPRTGPGPPERAGVAGALRGARRRDPVRPASGGAWAGWTAVGRRCGSGCWRWSWSWACSSSRRSPGRWRTPPATTGARTTRSGRRCGTARCSGSRSVRCRGACSSSWRSALVGCVQRVRLRWVVVTWAACVLLFAVAATGRPGWGSLVTGYWYNDKVRIAALVVVAGHAAGRRRHAYRRPAAVRSC